MNEQIGFECVLPIESHAKLIMEWRNDPQTLAMSFHMQPKEWSTFYPEFLNEYFAFPDLPPLFALYKGQRAAFVRLEPAPSLDNFIRRCCEISINVAPAFRRRGIGVMVLKALKSWAAQQGYDDLYAEVKQENSASIKAFQRAGYTQLTPAKRVIPFTIDSVPIERFAAFLSPKKKQEAVFIIAEAGSNWKAGTPEEDLDLARQLIQNAADAGADAVKFQVFRPETVYVPNAGTSDYLSEAGIKEDIRSIFSHLTMPYKLVPKLAAFCKQCGIQFMASAFSKADFEAVDPYVSVHKIPSYEITHVRLLELAARTKKPLLISTGAAQEQEIAWALDSIKVNQGGPVTLLQCTARYPAPVNAMHLLTIPWLKHRFNTSVGLSDHSREPVPAPVAAVALGAKVIEKHFTVNRSRPGPDHAFAITPPELKEMVQAIRQTEQMLGSEVKIIDPCEEELRAYAQRGIQAINDIQPGDIFEEDVNIAILRAGKQIKGIHPLYLQELQGKPSTRAIPLGSGVQIGDWLP
jgi:N-acetylneuraminate synthase